MPDQITIEEALKLVDFYHSQWGWRIRDVNSDVFGNVAGNVYGTIRGRKWMVVETPEQKFKRLLQETHNLELIGAFNKMEENR